MPIDRVSSSSGSRVRELAITTVHTGTTATIELIGELDVAAVADVSDVVELVAATEGLTVLHVDATRLTFFDSTGLMILLRARQVAQDHLLTFTLAATQAGPVARVIDLCGLDRWFAECRS